MGLRTVVGRVKVEVWHGQDPGDEHWGCPMREGWGLKAHQQMSPALEEKLAFTATLAGSYDAAALVVGKWGCEIDDSVIHALVQRLGSKAEAQTQERIKEVPQESQPQRKASELALLMMDGWFARFRGPGWGKRTTKKERVEWHEIKNGVFYLHEQAGQTEGGRGVIADKTVVRWQGEPVELGRRLHWEALRGGLGRAKAKLVLGDGMPWIWNLAADRWPDARKLLDFWHGGAPWPRAGGVKGDRCAQSAPRPGWQGRAKTAELFCRSSRADELPGDRRSRVAHRQWAGRIVLCPRSMSLQATRPILDLARFSALERTG